MFSFCKNRLFLVLSQEFPASEFAKECLYPCTVTQVELNNPFFVKLFSRTSPKPSAGFSAPVHRDDCDFVVMFPTSYLLLAEVTPPPPPAILTISSEVVCTLQSLASISDVLFIVWLVRTCVNRSLGSSKRGTCDLKLIFL